MYGVTITSEIKAKPLNNRLLVSCVKHWPKSGENVSNIGSLRVLAYEEDDISNIDSKFQDDTSRNFSKWQF